MTTEDLRHCLKAITAQIVEDKGKKAESGYSTKTTSAGTTLQRDFTIDYALMESEPGTRRSAERLRNPQKSLQISPQTHHKKSLSLLLPVAPLPTSPHSDLTAISDFSVPTPSVLFAKASRQTLEVRDLSPGSAYYSPSVDSSKEHHCSVAFPKGGKRYEYRSRRGWLYTRL